MTPHLTPRRERWLLLTLAGIQFTHILDFMIMMPLGPQFTRLFGISNAEFGVLVSAYTLSAGASGLLAATYVDRFSRKRLLLTMYTLFGLATLACGLAPGYGWLMVARVAAGVFGGVLSALSQTIVADVIPFERRGQAMGVVMTSFSVSTVAGVPLGLFLAAHLSWHAPFMAIAAMVGLLVIGAWQTLPQLDAHLHHPERASVWRSIGQVLVDANHMKAFALSAVMMFAGFTVIPYITIYLQSNAGMKTGEVPWIYLFGGVATAKNTMASTDVFDLKLLDRAQARASTMVAVRPACRRSPPWQSRRRSRRACCAGRRGPRRGRPCRAWRAASWRGRPWPCPPRPR